MAAFHPPRQFNGVVSNDAFGARAAVAVDGNNRRLWSKAEIPTRGATHAWPDKKPPLKKGRQMFKVLEPLR